MSINEQFQAAVKTVQAMPKRGHFQPSNSLKLRFYSLFKQATEGPCSTPKPRFFDIEGRAKWNEWNKLGNLNKEEAMQLYVDEFKQIILERSTDEEILSMTTIPEVFDPSPLITFLAFMKESEEQVGIIKDVDEVKNTKATEVK